MKHRNDILTRVTSFCDTYNLTVPIILAPMAGACPPALSIAVANAGGMGGCGALLMSPEDIKSWAQTFRSTSNGAFQMNLWIPDAAPIRDAAAEAEMRKFLANWGPEVAEDAGDGIPPDFHAQCRAIIEAGPGVMSSIMGLYPGDIVQAMKENNIKWFATVTTVEEALAAEAAGADVIIAQGAEAGGHRGAFNPNDAMRKAAGLFSLLPSIVDAVDVPVVATGGIADGRGIAAALTLGASAVQIGTGFLRTPQSTIAPEWADALAITKPEDTLVTRAFSGRAGRAVAGDYAKALEKETAPSPAPYPVQRGLTGAMRAEATKTGDVSRMQAWAGQSAALSSDKSADDLVRELWTDAKAFLE